MERPGGAPTGGRPPVQARPSVRCGARAAPSGLGRLAGLFLHPGVELVRLDDEPLVGGLPDLFHLVEGSSLKVSLRPSTAVTSVTTRTSMPRGVGARCFRFMDMPTDCMPGSRCSSMSMAETCSMSRPGRGLQRHPEDSRKSGGPNVPAGSSVSVPSSCRPKKPRSWPPPVLLKGRNKTPGNHGKSRKGTAARKGKERFVRGESAEGARDDSVQYPSKSAGMCQERSRPRVLTPSGCALSFQEIGFHGPSRADHPTRAPLT